MDFCASDHAAASVAAKMAMDAEPILVREFDGDDGVSPLEIDTQPTSSKRKEEKIQ